MRHLSIISIFVFFLIINIYSQMLPDFMVANTNIVTSYFSAFSFNEIESEKEGKDFLFTDKVRPRQGDTITTDTLFFALTQLYAKLRIKKISLARNGIEYFSVDSFPMCDTLKWKLVKNYRPDSILLLDSLLDIRFSSETGILRFCLGKKYTFVKNDVFKIVLDTIPLRIKIGTYPSKVNVITNISAFKTGKFLHVNQHYALNHTRGKYNIFYNLAGKRQREYNYSSNIIITNYNLLKGVRNLD